MKIGAMNVSWPFNSPFPKLPLGTKKFATVDNSFAAKAGHKAFSPHGSSAERDFGECALKELDVDLLRELAESFDGKRFSYQGFISSQLQHGPVDDQTKLALTRAMAVKRMLTLVNATVEEMKTIELRRISYSKG